MITITKKEKIVLNQIKLFNIEYPNGIPETVLRMELGYREYDLNKILKVLDEKKLINYSNGTIKYIETDKEINTVESHKEVKKAELNLKEEKSLEIIKKLVNDENLVSRYILEGNLLYSDLDISNFRMYHIILSLENKGILKPIHKSDGDYYLLTN